MSLVSFDDVGKTYRSLHGVDYQALAHFSVEIEVGEFFCLLGPSGCGKTTVLKMLAGFEAPTSGQISMSGRPVTGAGRDRGVVFQGDDSLYGWLTAVENVEFGLRMRGVAKPERRERALRYLKLVGLSGQEQKYPAELSGGMKQRVGIARALSVEPEMLLFDEPTAGLDPTNAKLVADLMLDLRGGVCDTAMVVTHDIDLARTVADRVAVLIEGRFAAVGPAERVLSGDDPAVRAFLAGAAR